MKSKFKTKFNKLSAKNLLYILVTLVIWYIFWLPFQMVFIADIPVLTEMVSLESLSIGGKLLIYSAVWILSLLIAWFVYHKSVRDYSFLKTKKWILVLYLLPIAAAINLYVHNPTEIYGANTIIYLLAMLISVGYQDILTFGFLQTILEKSTTRIIAALVTALVFYIGHLNFGFDLFSLIHILGYVVFVFTRYKTGAIYVTNVIHLTYILAV